MQSLERGLAVIRAFGRESASPTLADVARSAGLNRSTARRLLHTLAALGYVVNEGRTWRLTPRVLDLGYAYLSSSSVWDVVTDSLVGLVDEVHETASAAVLDGTDIVFTVRVPTKRLMSMNIEVGARIPAYATAMGRVLLAELPDAELDAYFAAWKPDEITPFTVGSEAELRRELDGVRAEGYCLIDQELEIGARSVAVPVHDRSGRTIGTVSIAAHTLRVSLEHMLEEILPRLQRAAAEIDFSLRLRS